MDGWRFAEFELDQGTAELRRNGERLPIAPRSLALLTYLVRHRDRTISRSELVANVWGGLVLAEGALRQAIWEVRRVLDDDAASERYVKALRGLGYRFVADASVDEPPPPPSHGPSQALSVDLAQSRLNLIGREAELLRLNRALDGARYSSGRACVLRGAAGIGKSQLAREMVLRAGEQGIAAIETCAQRDVAAPPLWPFIQLLGQLLGDLTAEQRAQHARRAPRVFRLLAQVFGRAAVDSALESAGPELLRIELFEEFAQLFVAFSLRSPFLVLLEDVQWFDDTSCAFLRHLSGALPRSRILLLMTCRTFARRDARALAKTLDVFVRGHANEVIALEPLDHAAVEQVLSVYAGPAQAAHLAGQVHALTRGNPLFIREIAHLLQGSALSAEAPVFEQLDGELRSVIRRRLAALPERCVELVQAASIWGEDCSAAELSALLGTTLAQTLEDLDECRRQGFLVERAGTHRHAFSHPLLAEEADTSLSSSERCRLHLAAGRWLEQRADAQERRLHELAHHFFCAALAEPERAVRYVSRFAERAYAARAYDLAASQYARALSVVDLIDGFSPAQRIALELAQGNAVRGTAADWRALNARFRDLADRASALGETRLAAEAALGYCGHTSSAYSKSRFSGMRDPTEVALLDRALATVPSDEVALRALLSCAQSMALVYAPERQRREQLAHEAVTLAEQTGSPMLLARTLLSQIYTCAAPESHAQQRSACDRLVALAVTHDLKEIELGARIARNLCLLSVLDLRAAERDEARARHLADELSREHLRLTSLAPSVLRAFWSGQLDEAERLTTATYEGNRSDPMGQAVHLARTSALALIRGGPEHLDLTIAQWETVLAAFPDAVSCHCMLASAYAAKGEPNAAREHFDCVARDDFRALPEGSNWFSEMLALGDAAVRLNDPERAGPVYARLLPYSDRMAFFHVLAVPVGPVARGLAELAVVLGDLSAARRWLAQSRQMNERAGAHLFLQYDSLAELSLLAAERPRGWCERAWHLLDELRAFSQATGARWLEGCAIEAQSRYFGKSLTHLPLPRPRESKA